MTELIEITHFVGGAFLHLWPYLLLTIPVAVAVKMSGAARYVRRAFDASPCNAILLATVFGAFSPFCSCGVIPVVAAMLISGVPLAPVMSFWVASPSMDPEIFFLSVGAVGWNLALWRLLGTFLLSLSAGFVTLLASRRGWFGSQVLRRQDAHDKPDNNILRQNALKGLRRRVKDWVPLRSAAPVRGRLVVCCAGSAAAMDGIQPNIHVSGNHVRLEVDRNGVPDEACGCGGDSVFWRRLFNESLSATLMVLKFMTLAFVLEALIVLYVPQEWIVGLLGQGNAWAVMAAALLGVPVYTSNLSALPLVSGLLAQGMNPAAALAFLIAGPTTTLPAMAAVWPLVSRRVFIWYVSFALFGAMVLGYLKLIIG